MITAMCICLHTMMIGIWVKDLKMKVYLHQNVVTRILKTLEAKRLIKAVRSIKNSTRKVHMLFELQPSVDVTGGPWFSDNEFDAEFINGLSKAIHKYIITMNTSDSTIKRPAGDQYPSLRQIHAFIQQSGISNVSLSVEDIQSILNSLIHDDKIEQMDNSRRATMAKKPGSNRMIIQEDVIDDMDDMEGDKFVYRTIRSPSHESDPILHCHLTDLPCGHCPVFFQCSDFGLVTPAKCEYFTKWLSF